jgi:iron complex outermembrane receptor protein
MIADNTDTGHARRARIWLGGLVTAGLLASTAARAQEQPAEVGIGSHDIVVTARRKEEDAAKVPVAVSYVSGAQIDALTINTPLDLSKIAGLGGAPVGSITSVNFSLRGQGTAFAGQPGVIPYFAEVPNFPLTYFDLASVQVIKGPQGTLFGQTSTGGVVLFEPRPPSFEMEGFAKVELGNHRFVEVDGALNLPLEADKLALRAAFRVRERSGWARALRARRSDDLGNVDALSGRLSLLWRPSPSVDNLTIVALDRIRNNGTLSPLYYIDTRFMNPSVRNLVPAAVPSIAAGWRFWTGRSPVPGQTFAQALVDAFDRQQAVGARAMYTDYRQDNETINKGLINQTDWQATEGVRIRNIVGLRVQTTQGATYDQDATDLPLLDFQCRFVPGTTSSAGRCARTGGWPARTFTEELQLQGELLRSKLQWQVGAFYLAGGSRKFREDSRPFIVFGNLSGDPASAAFCASVQVPAPCASMSRTRTRSFALFGQATYEITDGIHLTGGMRETWDRTRTDTTGKPSYQVPFDGRSITVPVYGADPAPTAGRLRTVVDLPANFSYNLSADWQASDSLFLYVAHRSGYKSGGINVVADPGSPDRVYGPERAKDLEIGAKARFALGTVRGRINADFYRTWFSDIQQGEILAGTAQTVTRNLADAKINGVEVEGALDFPLGFSLAGHLTYTDARYTRWLETSSCAAQYWRPQCSGLAGATPILIDHAGGRLDLAGQTIAFRPDRFANTSRWQWSIQPALSVKGWIDQDITLAANIYHRGPYVDAVAVANNSKIAGVTMPVERTVYGYSTADPYDAPGYTLVDLRLDWRNVAGTRLSLAAAVTNAANRNYRVSSASAFEIIGAVYSITGEPRMALVEARYAF